MSLGPSTGPLAWPAGREWQFQVHCLHCVKFAIAESRRAFFRATANGVMQAWFSWRGKQGSIETTILARPVLYHRSQFPPREHVGNSTTAWLLFTVYIDHGYTCRLDKSRWSEPPRKRPSWTTDERAPSSLRDFERRQPEPLRTVLGRTRRSISLRGTPVRTLGARPFLQHARLVV